MRAVDPDGGAPASRSRLAGPGPRRPGGSASPAPPSPSSCAATATGQGRPTRPLLAPAPLVAPHGAVRDGGRAPPAPRGRRWARGQGRGASLGMAIPWLALLESACYL